MGRKERTAFESKSSVNRDCQLKHNLSVFDSLHSIDLIIGRVNSRHFLPTYLPTLLYDLPTLLYNLPRESKGEHIPWSKSWDFLTAKKSQSQGCCALAENHSRPLYFEGPVWKRLLQKFTLFTLKRVSIKVSLIEDSFENFFLSFMQIQSNMTLFGQYII